MRQIVLSTAMLLCMAASAAAQKQQWTDVVYVPGSWQARKLAPPAGKDTLALVMRVDYFANGSRWRAEIRRTTDGVDFAEPVIVLGDKQNVQVMTPLGATPLEQHALNNDSLVRAAIVFDANGKRVGAASGTIVERDAGGTVRRVAFRRAALAAVF